MRQAWWLALVLLAACPKTQSRQCTATNCSGCCSADDTCSVGASAAACGFGGQQCVACDAEKICTLGVCTLTGSGGSGGGSSTGGGAATGGGSATGGGVATGGGSPTDGGAALLGIAAEYLPDGGGEEQLRVIDPSTGLSTRLAGIPGLKWVRSGVTTDDPASRLIYLVGQGASGADQLYVIDEEAGTLVRTTPLDEDGGLDWSGGLHVRSDHALVGITWHIVSDGGSEELRLLDTTAGTSTLVAAIPKLDYVVDSANAYDPVNDQLYLLGFSNADVSWYLFQVDAVSGASTTSVALGQMSPNWFQMSVRSDGQLLAVGLVPDGGFGLVTVEPHSGTATVVAPTLGLNLLSFDSTYDRVADRFYVIGDVGNTGPDHLAAVDGISGAVLSNQVLTGDTGATLSWAGLYFRR